MRILSLLQPWATLVAAGFKLWETRSWKTSWRGQVAIHASKSAKMMPLLSEIAREAGIEDALRTLPPWALWPMGSVLAVVRIADCLPTEKIRGHLTAREIALGDYSSGRFAWKLEDLRVVRPPVPARGARGLVNLEPGLAEIVRRQVA